jgi:ubiquinone/menaquinone biosynthesis C-methylase UbiE
MPRSFPFHCVMVVACWLTVSVAAAADRTQQPPRPQEHGRLFPPTDLGLLEAPDRDLWQPPDQIMDVLGIAEASVVADVGAGSGWFTVRLARRVGPNGVVYAQDVQQEMLQAIKRRVEREGLTNVRPVLGQGSNPRLPRNTLDAILIVGVYNEIGDKVEMLRNLAAALKPQGRIGVIDFKLSGGGPGPPMAERVDPRIVVRDAASAGLRLLSQETFLPYQYFLVFAKERRTKNEELRTKN